MVRVKFLEKARAFRRMEFRILRLDANKKTVRGGMREAVHVENRMIRLGQFVQGEHTENRGERRPENGQLKGDGNKRRPAIQRAAADIHRISNGGCPVLKTKTAEAASEAAEQGNRRHQVALKAQGLRETLDREGSKSIEATVARPAHFLHGVEEFFRLAELAHHTVNV